MMASISFASLNLFAFVFVLHCKNAISAKYTPQGELLFPDVLEHSNTDKKKVDQQRNTNISMGNNNFENSQYPMSADHNHNINMQNMHDLKSPDSQMNYNETIDGRKSYSQHLVKGDDGYSPDNDGDKNEDRDNENDRAKKDIAYADKIFNEVTKMAQSTTFTTDRGRMDHLHTAVELKYGSGHKSTDLLKALKIFKELAGGQRDTVEAQSLYELGESYCFGFKSKWGFERDLEKASYYIFESALLGYGPSLHLLAFFFAQGIGRFEKNEHVASRLQYLASLTGFIPSIMTMGFRFFQGDGVLKDCPMALHHYRYAAEVAIQMSLSQPSIPLSETDRLHERTISDWNNIQNFQSQQAQKEVMQYWEHAAKEGDPMAKYEFAKLLEYQNESAASHSPSEETDKKIAALLKSCGEDNLALALRDLGMMYLQGRGVPQDLDKAIECFIGAADLGNPEAQNYIGYLYYFGARIPEFDNARDLPSPTQKHGLERDEKKALYYFKKAAMQDFPESLFFLAEIQVDAFGFHPEMKVSEERFRMAFRLYQRAADYGYMHAMFREAQMREVGKGIPSSCFETTLAYKAVAEAGPGVEDLRKGMKAYVSGDFEGALLRYGLAAEEGYEIAQMNAAFLLQNGHHFFISKNKASIFLHDQNGKHETLALSSSASVSPSSVLEKGESESLSFWNIIPKTLAWFSNSSSKNFIYTTSNNDAQKKVSSTKATNIGISAHRRDGRVETDTNEVYHPIYRSLNRAALQGNPSALRLLGSMYLFQKFGATSDPLLASYVLKRSLQLGDTKSLLDIATFFEKHSSHIPRALDHAEDMIRYFKEEWQKNKDVRAFGLPDGLSSSLKNGMRSAFTSMKLNARLARIKLKKKLNQFS